MHPHADALRTRLSSGPVPARQLIDFLQISQPTLSRALASLGDQLVRVGAARSIQYALRDDARGVPDLRIYRVDGDGQIQPLGTLVPVRAEGFVMQQEDGRSLHSEGRPWWLFDMRPQGYLGRAYVARHAAALGLPPRLDDWTDSHTLRALLMHGHDVVGNLLVGDMARDRFLATPLPEPIAEDRKPTEYAQLARRAASGERPGSSAGGGQPKFAAFVHTQSGPRHVLVKFSESEAGPVSERWRDLLLIEHLALETLREAGVAAAASRVIDTGGQRFLEVERFDRNGELGRHALFSLAALDAEFVGSGNGRWPVIVRKLAIARLVRAAAVQDTELLWAFGTLIGNSDMHNGNLSFIAGHGGSYGLAPAYDMTAMALRPTAGGALPDTLAEAVLHADVPHAAWRRAHALAQRFMERLGSAKGFSARFAPCMAALASHVATAAQKIGRLS